MIDLKSEVINIISEADVDLAKKFQRRFRAVIGQNDELEQLRALSFFWNMQLGMLPVTMITEREYLAIDVDSKMWLARFRKHILPVIISHRLPL